MKENKHIWRKARKKPIVVEFREVDGKEQIETREGILTANQEKDYIIRGVDGEIYPIKKSIFYRTYDIIEENMNELELLDLDSEIKIPDNELAQSCFKMILRALISDKKQFDTEEEAINCIFSLLNEFKDDIKNRIKLACEFYLKYKDKPKLLGWNYPLLIDKIDEIYKRRIEAEEALGPNYKPSNTFIDEYNEWFFKEVFRNVLGGGRK